MCCAGLRFLGGLVIKAQNYVKAKIRSRIFNIAAIVIAGFGILIAVQTYSKNVNQESFWMELGNPVSIGLILFPFLVAGILMYLSSLADKQMEEILRQHQADLKKGSSKGSS